jgi:hypothetical protein
LLGYSEISLRGQAALLCGHGNGESTAIGVPGVFSGERQTILFVFENDVTLVVDAGIRDGGDWVTSALETFAVGLGKRAENAETLKMPSPAVRR